MGQLVMHLSSAPAVRRWRHLAAVVGTAVLVAALPGCRVGEERAAGRTTPATSAREHELPAPPARIRDTGASTGLPAYDGPPEDGPPSAGPLGTVLAAVDLTAVAPGDFSRVEAAVAAPDGTVHVVLSPVNSSRPPRLGTVSHGQVTGSVELSRVDDVWGMHQLPDGTVAVSGALRSTDGRREGYGTAVVDPETGSARITVLVAYTGKTRFSFGRSALSPDGRTLFFFVSTVTAAGSQERLFAMEPANGDVPFGIDLAADIAAASAAPAGHELAGLVPLLDGGVTLVLDASPDVTRPERIPTLLTYDVLLQRVGDPVRVTSLSERAQTQAVAAGADGTTFLVVSVGDGAWVLAVPPRGGAGPVLVQLDDHFYDYALVVEPAQVWGLLPAPDGARAVDLTTGELSDQIDVGCPGQDVRGMFPGAGATALLVGECNAPRTRTQMLWILGP
jgi:hypothetical protein